MVKVFTEVCIWAFGTELGTSKNRKITGLRSHKRKSKLVVLNKPLLKQVAEN